MMIPSKLRTTIALFIFPGFLATISAAQSADTQAKSATPQPKQQNASASTAQKSGEGTAEWKQIKKPPLPAFHPQEPKRIQLANGMIIFLQEDHELPLIDGTAYIRGGARDVPAEKTGMTSI